MNLDIYLAGRRIARTVPRSRGRTFVVEYDSDVVTSLPAEAVVLSCSLPTPGPSTPSAGRAFLEGLLPEGQALQAMAARVRGVRLTLDDATPATPSDVLALLAEYGRECAGAVALVPGGDTPTGRGNYAPVGKQEIATMVSDLPTAPLGADPSRDLRMSLAGYQPKVLLARFRGSWFLPRGGAASTHILKPESEWPSSADNEATVMRLAREVGLTTVDTWVETIGDRRVLVTERFDRVVDEDTRTVLRLHQEDMCQALGWRPRDKYHLGRMSGPIATLLRSVPLRAGSGVRDTFRQLVFRVIIGDEDGHGKNYGLLLAGGEVGVAPAYDCLCTQLYPALTGTMAAPVGPARNLAAVRLVDLVAEGAACGIPESETRSIIATLADRVRSALVAADTIAPEVLESVMGTARLRASRLLAGEPLGTPGPGAMLGGAGRGSGAGTMDSLSGRR